MEELISIAEYAKIHNVAPVTVRQKAQRGNLVTAKKIGRDWFVNRNEIYLDNRKKK